MNKHESIHLQRSSKLHFKGPLLLTQDAGLEFCWSHPDFQHTLFDDFEHLGPPGRSKEGLNIRESWVLGGAEKLRSGAEKLYSGAGKLRSGAGKLHSGAGKLHSGA